MLNINQKKLVTEYRRLTQQNHHGEALHLLANAFGLIKYSKIISLVNQIAQIEGGLTHELNLYRETLRGGVEHYVRETFPDVWDAIVEVSEPETNDAGIPDDKFRADIHA